MKSGIEVPSSKAEIDERVLSLTPEESLAILSQETPERLNFLCLCAMQNNPLASYYAFKLFEKAYSKNPTAKRVIDLINAKTQERTPLYIAAQENNTQFVTLFLKHKVGVSTQNAGPVDCPSALVAAAKVGACDAVVAICDNQKTKYTKKDLYEIHYNPSHRGRKTLLDYLALHDKTGEAIYAVLNNSESHFQSDFHACTKEVDEMGHSAFSYLLQNPNCTSVLTHLFSQIESQWSKGWYINHIFDFNTRRANGYTDLELAIKIQDPQLLALLKKSVDPKLFEPAYTKISDEIAQIAARVKAESEERAAIQRAQQLKAAEEAKQKAEQQKAALIKQKEDIKSRYAKLHAEQLKAQEEVRVKAELQKAAQLKAIEDAQQEAQAQLQAVREAAGEFKREHAQKLDAQREAQEISSKAIVAPLRALEKGLKASIAKEENAIEDKYIADNAPGFDTSWQPFLERLHALDRNVSLLAPDGKNSEWRRERFNENLARIHESQLVELESLTLNWDHIQKSLPEETIAHFHSLDTNKTLSSIEARHEVLNEINAILIGTKIRLDEPYLYLKKCFLTRIPEILFEREEDLPYWEKVIDIDCSNNSLLTLPHGLAKCTALSRLRCNGNRLSELPQIVAQLPNLTQLECSNNNLRSVPEALQNSQGLTTLDCSHNQITSLPPMLGINGRLEILNCKANQLQSLPAQLARCRSLCQLNCSNNVISFLPRKLGQTRSLEVLECENNQIGFLPASLGKSRKVKIKCANNYIESIPNQIIANLGENWESGVLSVQKPLQERPPVEDFEGLDQQTLKTIEAGESNEFSGMHKDVLRIVLSYLSQKDIDSLMLVSKSLHAKLSADAMDVVWSPYLNRLKALDPNFSIMPPSNAEQFAWRRARFREGFEIIRQRQKAEVEALSMITLVSMTDEDFGLHMERHTAILEQIVQSIDSGTESGWNTLDDLEAIDSLLNDINDFFARKCIQPEQTTLDLNMGGLGKFTRLPNSVLRDETLQAYLKNITVLRCQDNLLQSLPDLSMCQSLEEIDVSFNQLQSLSNSLGSLPALLLLNVEGNELKSLPATLSGSQTLQELNCARNELTALPKCSTLRSLHCEFNRLQVLPELDVQVLEELSMGHNNVMSVPSKIREKFDAEWARTNIDTQQQPQEPYVEAQPPLLSRTAPVASALALRKDREQDVKVDAPDQESKWSPESKLKKQ